LMQSCITNLKLIETVKNLDGKLVNQAPSP
jgi:hypothetical protein